MEGSTQTLIIYTCTFMTEGSQTTCIASGLAIRIHYCTQEAGF